jgi:hypothetical protein
MTVVIWVGRRPPSEKHLEILARAFGDEIELRMRRTVLSWEVFNLIQKYGSATIVGELSPDKIQKILKMDGDVYQFRTSTIRLPDGRVREIPIGLQRVLRVEYDVEEVV